MDSPNSPGLLKRFWDFISSPNYRRTASVLGILVLVAAIPLTVFIAQRQQELRQRASGDGSIQFVDSSGNALPSTISDPNVYLKVTLPDNMAYFLPSEPLQNKSIVQKTYAQAAITADGTPSCSGSDSRIIWTWSGGSGNYAKLGIRNDTTGQFEFHTPLLDQTTFIRTNLPENNRFRLQVFDDSGEDGLSPLVTSLSCGPDPTSMPMPTATSAPPLPCSSFTNCGACIGAPRDCGWDGGNCRELPQACPANETFWFFRSCSINECTEAPPPQTPPPSTPTPSCIQWDPQNCSSAVSPGRCTDHGLPGYCNWGEELRYACRDRCKDTGTAERQPLKDIVIENVDGGTGGSPKFTAGNSDPRFQGEKDKLLNGTFLWKLNTNSGPKLVKITFTDINNNTKIAESQEVTLSVGATGACGDRKPNETVPPNTSLNPNNYIWKNHCDVPTSCYKSNDPSTAHDNCKQFATKNDPFVNENTSYWCYGFQGPNGESDNPDYFRCLTLTYTGSRGAPTSTPVPSTPTSTPIPPPGATATPIPPPGPTATPTLTPVPTGPTPTSTPIPPPGATATPTPTSTPVPTATIGPTTTPIPGGVQVVLTLKLQGIGGAAENGSPVRPQRAVTVQFFNQGNTKIAEQSGLVTYNGFSGTFNGTIDMTFVPAGSYAVKAKIQGYLNKLVQPVLQITNAGAYPISGTPQIIGGDMNNDNTLDVLDYSLFVRCFGARADTSSCTNKQTADMDDNGKVDGIDYQLFVKGLSIHLGD